MWLFQYIWISLFKETHQLTLVMMKKLRCHAHFQFSANQITWSSFKIKIHILNDKQCRSSSIGFWRSQLIWIYTVCKGRTYPGSAGPGLRDFIFQVLRIRFKAWSPYVLELEMNEECLQMSRNVRQRTVGHVLPANAQSGLEVIKLFSCSTQLSMKFSLLIKMKMPTNVGIFIFISREMFMLSYF